MKYFCYAFRWKDLLHIELKVKNKKRIMSSLYGCCVATLKNAYLVSLPKIIYTLYVSFIKPNGKDLSVI